MNKKIIYALGFAVLLVGFIIWLFLESAKPLPGTKIEDLGRGHVDVGTEVKYNSNPPTSGEHYVEWTRQGVYTDAPDDRNLVHSLEHGYVVMHYKCSPSEADQTEATNSAMSDADCEDRRDKLETVYENKGKYKLIVIPRPDLDTNFALTAWNYIDKFDDFDRGRIEKFIDAHLNMGPEKTME